MFARRCDIHAWLVLSLTRLLWNRGMKVQQTEGAPSGLVSPRLHSIRKYVAVGRMQQPANAVIGRHTYFSTYAPLDCSSATRAGQWEERTITKIPYKGCLIPTLFLPLFFSEKRRTECRHRPQLTQQNLRSILHRPNMATQKASLIEKLALFPHLAIGISLGLLRLAGRPFNSSSKPPTAYKDFIYTLARYVLSNMTIAHEKWLNPSTESSYLSFASQKGFQPDTAVLASGLKVHWIGNKGAEKVFLYFHGGGYVNPLSPAHLEWLYELQADLSKTKSTAIAAVGYTCSPEGQYPLQLKQAAESLIWLLQGQGKKPEDVRTCFHQEHAAQGPEMSNTSFAGLRRRRLSRWTRDSRSAIAHPPPSPGPLREPPRATARSSRRCPPHQPVGQIRNRRRFRQTQRRERLCLRRSRGQVVFSFHG